MRNISLPISIMKPEHSNHLRGLLAFALILLGFIIAIFTGFDQPLVMGLLNAGMILLIINFIQKRRLLKGKIIKDERTEKIGHKSLAHSWLWTFLTLNILFWVDYSSVLELTISQFFGIVFIVMLVTPHFFAIYFRNHGEL